MQPRATGALVKHHQLFTFFEAPERRRQRAHVKGLRGDVEKMRQDAADFRVEHPDQLPALGYGHAGELFHGQRERMLLVHRRDVVEPVEIGNRLQVGLGLDQLLGAAVQQTDMRIDPLDNLAIEFQHQPEHAVCRRMLGTEVDVEVTDVVFVHGSRPQPLAFSSPGST